ncbi:TPA: restriction endonuclease subunit S [Bacillus cereus]
MGSENLFNRQELEQVFTISTKTVNPNIHAKQKYKHFSIPAFDELKTPIIEVGEQIKSNKYLLERDSILVSKLNPRIKRVWQYKYSQEEAIPVCSTEFIVYQPKTKIVNMEFYFHYFNSEIFQEYLLGLQSGTTGSRMRVTPKATFKLKIPIPTINEQQKIASILSSVDELIEKTEAVIGQTERVKRGVMQKLLIKGIGHTKFKKTEFGEIPKMWESVKFETLFKIKHGYAFKSEFFKDEGKYILLTPGNFEASGGLKLKGNKEKYYIGEVPQEYILNKDDLLVVLTDLTKECKILGSPAFIKEDNYFLHNQRLGKIIELDEEKINKRYLFHLFNSSLYRQHLKNTATGTTVRHTSPDRICEVTVPLPLLEEQEKIDSILSTVESKLKIENKKLFTLKQLKKGLMQSLLTGQVRVKVDEDEVTQA